jgi:hypothetical protein
VAKVKISARECRRGMLPQVCAKCGDPTSETVRRKFQWFPPIAYIAILAGLLPFAIIALVLTKRLEADMPMCEKHKKDWAWRQWFVVGGLLLLLVGGIGAFAFAASQQQGPNDGTVGFVCLGSAIALLVFLIPAAFINNAAIRPTEITDKGMTLINVHRDFIAELEEDRDRDYEEEEKRRAERRAQRKADGDDRERPRPKRRVYDEDNDDLDRRARDDR